MYWTMGSAMTNSSSPVDASVRAVACYLPDMAADHLPSASAQTGAAEVPLSLLWGAVLLSVALSGFFDGILLHQVLRWHHLLSGVQDPRWLDPERQGAPSTHRVAATVPTCTKTAQCSPATLPG